MQRRQFLQAGPAFVLGSSILRAAPKWAKVPIGLELYSVREDFMKDMPGTLKVVAQAGYQGVEMWGPYADWDAAKAKEFTKMVHDLGMKVFSTHTGYKYFAPEYLNQVADLNGIMETRFMVMSSAGQIKNLDGWKEVAAKLNVAAEKLKPMGKRTGFHNHAVEFTPLEGKRPIEVLAKETPSSVVLQLDVGTCLAAGSDPIAWVKANPGRFGSVHLKDWKAGTGDVRTGYHVLFGEGYQNWPALLEAAATKGSAEHFLIEQEGGVKHTPYETIAKCLENYKRMRGDKS
ncbi:sugar phosphate isomerase/epimerase family protein [Oscillatoria amoena NRMC-F 0135]|jgi:sugar phosphate isomerase/epimerase|nr:sugar phosphate isomerase/epimerase family protein [Oscillatoria amoena NRMC-F 0135]